MTEAAGNQRVGLFVKVSDEARKEADRLEAWLRERDVTVVRKESVPPGRDLPPSGESPAPPDLSCIFVLGGDGTFLSAARWVGEHPIPLLGVKFGEVGFLAESTAEGLLPAAAAILAGRFSTVSRMRLRVRVLRDEREVMRETVLNDIVITKGALARLARIQTYIDDRYLTTYRADGLILATPTGSTAYSLAAGGPILYPTVPGIIMTPICPFTLTNRPLIVPDSVGIKIRLGPDAADIVLTFDGQSGMAISERDTILVEKGPNPIRMIAMPDRHYFDVLKTKLRWSGERI
jgi:NAD+ kinase